ncbi:hypothetical protein [Enterococcus columbae]|uniref:Viral A-type inclusion protein n=1 Tax=Enterococcus columbae DSM 7374 = ATCC 51263 TaxID=1121865 RepID=S1NWL8_9ENTE|nr:hypothetical protein [Enterococcus columbae]EOT44418.1 hypothetical protein OMW_00474 [Enterococcus columbae DSM 7374 = ATCC 51263]EOW84576.1 hypothetical protein I568_01072 [Enterococcus columbae DSM 7374 = ATCC 51263]OJG22512.1 hypothetical protein RR47_GL000951 [Enterococcus columbae DSM 7374 = ATCC 51263]
MFNENEYKQDELSFVEAKETASKNIGQLLEDLKAFEVAIQTENVAEIYRIYQGKLHKELKETSNQNHEIDDLLAKKLHHGFLARFPYMQLIQKVSPTIYYYKIDQYYHQRPTIVMDVSVPKIYIQSTVLNEWRNFDANDQSELLKIENKMNQIDVQNLTWQSEVAELETTLQQLEKQIEQTAQQKTIFNRVKNEEEYQQLLNSKEKLLERIKQIKNKITDKTQQAEMKEQMQAEYFALQLHRALIKKELRLLQKHAQSIDHLEAELMQFIADYLQPKEEGNEYA